MYYLGVDIGGTKTAVGLIDKYNKLLQIEIIPTDVKGGIDAISRDIAQLILKILKKQRFDYSNLGYIGVGCPGSINEKEGKIVYANNLNLSNAPLRAELQKYVPIPIFLDNDANCAGLGEFYALEKEQINNFFMITLGTGIGSASIINGKLFKGFNNAAPEIGHSIIVANGETCSCGNKGCWEMYCSGSALIIKAQEAAKKNLNSLMWEIAEGEISRVNGAVLFKAASEGDIASKRIVDDYLDYLKIGIINIVNSFQPEILVIGGGISEQGDLITRAAQNAVYEGSYGKDIKMTRVVKARLGNTAGVYGAAFLGK